MKRPPREGRPLVRVTRCDDAGVRTLPRGNSSSLGGARQEGGGVRSRVVRSCACSSGCDHTIMTIAHPDCARKGKCEAPSFGPCEIGVNAVDTPLALHYNVCSRQLSPWHRLNSARCSFHPQPSATPCGTFLSRAARRHLTVRLCLHRTPPLLLTTTREPEAIRDVGMGAPATVLATLGERRPERGCRLVVKAERAVDAAWGRLAPGEVRKGFQG